MEKTFNDGDSVPFRVDKQGKHEVDKVVMFRNRGDLCALTVQMKDRTGNAAGSGSTKDHLPLVIIGEIEEATELAFPDFKQWLVLGTDASKHQVSVCLFDSPIGNKDIQQL